MMKLKPVSSVVIGAGFLVMLYRVRLPKMVIWLRLSSAEGMRQEREFAKSLCLQLSVKDVWTTIAMTISRSRTFAVPAWMWLEGPIALSRLLVQLPLRLVLKLDDLKNQLQSWVKRHA